MRDRKIILKKDKIILSYIDEEVKKKVEFKDPHNLILYLKDK